MRNIMAFLCVGMMLAMPFVPSALATGEINTGTNFIGDLGMPMGSTNLVGHWKLDESSGDAINAASTGSTYDGTVTGATQGEIGKINDCYDFDGVADYINVSDGTDDLDFISGDDFSIFAWIFWDSTSAGYVLTKVSSYPNYGYYIYIDGNGSLDMIILSNGATLADIEMNITLNEWTHIGLTREANTCTGYKNGVNIGTDSTAGGNISNDETLCFGGNGAFNTWYGKLDDVRIYNAAIIPSATLISHWKLDETSGSTAEDSEDAHNGTISGATVNQDGKLDTGFSFDGNEDYTSVSDHDDLDFSSGEDFSIFAWVKTTTKNYGRIVEKRQYPGDAIGYYLCIDSNGYFLAGVDLGVNGSGVAGTTDIADGIWHHVGLVRDNDTIEAFVDGASIGTNIGASGDLSNSNYLYIGNDRCLWFDYTGYIDDVRFYQGVVDPTPSIISHWKFDESSGTTAEDYEGTHDGVIRNSPTMNVTGKVNKCFDFNQAYPCDYVGVTDHDDLDFSSGEDFSIFAWINTSQSSDYGYIIDKRYYSGGVCDGYLLALWADGTIRASVFQVSSSSSATIYSATTVVDGSWHHIGMVRDGDTLEIWIDGVCENSTSGASGNLANTGLFNIGRDWGGTYGFDGLIDDVRLYGEAVVPAN